MPVDPAMLARGPEWSVGDVGGMGGVGGVDQSGATPTAGGGGFGAVLGQELGKLADLQSQAAQASLDLAAGTAPDANAVVMAVERARLSMQLASQVRTKSVEALQDIFHTQV
jgi:flagellar hook-basal body complex protein FliE